MVQYAVQYVGPFVTTGCAPHRGQGSFIESIVVLPSVCRNDVVPVGALDDRRWHSVVLAVFDGPRFHHSLTTSQKLDPHGVRAWFDDDASGERAKAIIRTASDPIVLPRTRIIRARIETENRSLMTVNLHLVSRLNDDVRVTHTGLDHDFTSQIPRVRKRDGQYNDKAGDAYCRVTCSTLELT
ncbi:hypothetical protein CFB84_43225 [Burkholderia aenigmatica]|uniref:Uncharacterized protein n=1 Tax=Burkholderia aenigmatica TaxID=2015348 RepID=A0A228HM64_9BURK|nr:hypothetical protein CFB84_43225 [Burkholderia aenigmatica]